MQHILGKNRVPMLIIDHPGVIKDRRSFSARGAGILGLSNFGRDHTYALNEDMSINEERVIKFVDKYHDVPVFLFGFTFMVWKHFICQIIKKGLTFNLSNGVLVHSGGWKKLQDEAVSNEDFKKGALNALGIKKVHNFYGMVEQVGSIYMECEEGYLHAPDYSDIHIVDPRNMTRMPYGQRGVIALESILPISYPGHRILTEDEGTIIGDGDCKCGRKGKYFIVHGRLPKAELRGCSDTHAAEITARN
jgi:hypothetical protein